ncbi:SRPBCC family protein [Cypionkella sp.]|uniref:SRPBCC family protein n=1 Tax=Cypionkella sp. TaxID=2811411 RepID=UPI002ABC4AD2|nr:SRPBCC family protein [Cypionkella sp.]MDZ4395236.1 SRPBCC family protein [Cypionkella sp.]
MTDELSLTVSRLIAAPPERVFAAWLDPKMLLKFMTSGEGVSVAHAETDPRVGGRYAITMKVEDREIPHGGTYLEITPHSRLGFTWESPHSAEGSTISIDFTPQDGGTFVTLTQLRFKSEDSRDGHKRGWTSILNALQATLG